MKSYNEYILTMQTQNKFGVLTRVITQIRRRGCNIKSLNVAESNNPEVANINLSVATFRYLIDDIVFRLKNLSCVLSVEICDDSSVTREYALITVKKIDEGIKKIINKCDANIIDESGVLEIKGDTHQIDNLINELNVLTETEIVRSGVITIKKGER